MVTSGVNTANIVPKMKVTVLLATNLYVFILNYTLHLNVVLISGVNGVGKNYWKRGRAGRHRAGTILAS